jgi:chorismate--pyruvate lyase
MWHNFSVKIHHSKPALRSDCNFHWLKKPILSGDYHPWLIDKASLTKRLQQRHSDFAVKPILVDYAKPFYDEAALLALPAYQRALIREVFLMANSQALVFAHSVLPRKSLRGSWLGLRRLGTKPLGQTLFAAPQVRRMALRYKKLSPQHALYQRATKDVLHKPAYLWARRSVFSLNCANIMVTEVFLPQLLCADHDDKRTIFK